MDLDFLDDESKADLVLVWKNMSESDKAHFINQVALALSVWGSEERGKQIVVEILHLMVVNGTSTLADFGLYIDRIKENELGEKVKRASIIIEGYRIKNSLSSEPHQELV